MPSPDLSSDLGLNLSEYSLNRSPIKHPLPRWGKRFFTQRIGRLFVSLALLTATSCGPINSNASEKTATPTNLSKTSCGVVTPSDLGEGPFLSQIGTIYLNIGEDPSDPNLDMPLNELCNDDTLPAITVREDQAARDSVLFSAPGYDCGYFSRNFRDKPSNRIEIYFDYEPSGDPRDSSKQIKNKLIQRDLGEDNDFCGSPERSPLVRQYNNGEEVCLDEKNYYVTPENPWYVGQFRQSFKPCSVVSPD